MMKPVVKQPTEEQILAQRAQIYMQKREGYALNAALKMFESCETTPFHHEIDEIVEAADYFADALLKKLFADPDADKEDSGNKEAK